MAAPTTTRPPIEAATTARPTFGPTAAGRMVMAGGVLFAVGNLLHPLQHDDAAYDHPTWELAHVAIILSIVPLVLGLPTLVQALRARGAATTATLVAVLTVTGFVGMAPGLLAEAFIAPEIGFDAMQRFDESGFGALGGTLGMSWIGSLVALTLACRVARFGPVAVRWSFLAAAVGLLTIGMGTSRLAGAVIIGSTALYGVAIAALGRHLVRERG